jgi:hypothetical protein
MQQATTNHIQDDMDHYLTWENAQSFYQILQAAQAVRVAGVSGHAANVADNPNPACLKPSNVRNKSRPNFDA